ncbi:MAG: lysylphosphatidylglycerol synthase transmembrane domain-containing protein [Fidelibacterota bacterium]
MVKIAVGLGFTLGGLYIAFRRIDLVALGDILSRAHGAWIVLGALLLILSVWIRAMRWQILMGPIKKIGVVPLFSTTMIGYFGNSVLPLRMGELLRAHAIHREETTVTTASAFGTIVVERLLDLIGVIVLTVIFFFLYSVPPWLTRSGITLGVVVIGSSLILWWMQRAHRDWLERLDSVKLLQRGIGNDIRHLIHSFVEGLITLKRADRTGRVVLYTALMWFIYWVITQLSAYALDISLSWVEVGVILVATTMVISVPSAPGYIGTYHAAAFLIMTEMFGKPETVARAYAIVNHAVGFVPLILIGFFFLLKSSVRLGELKRLEIGDRP